MPLLPINQPQIFDMTLDDAEAIVGKYSLRHKQWVRRIGGLLITSALSATTSTGLVGGLALLEPIDRVLKTADELLLELKRATARASRHDRVEVIRALILISMCKSYFVALGEVLPREIMQQLNMADAQPSSRQHRESTTPKDSEKPPAFPVLAPTNTGLGMLVHNAHQFFQETGNRQIKILNGLSAWHSIAPGKRTLLRSKILNEIPGRAQEVFASELSHLITEMPDLGVWFIDTAGTESAQSQRHDHHKQITKLDRMLTILENGSIASQSSTDERDPFELINRLYINRLDEPALRTRNLGNGLSMPSIRSIYCPPTYRTAPCEAVDPISDPREWSLQDIPGIELTDYLAAELTNPGNFTQPVLLLGHPGSGKTLLCKVLLAQVSRTLTLQAVYVSLRAVSKIRPIEACIEEVLEREFGITQPFRDLNRHERQLVIVFDGLDELLLNSELDEVNNFLLDIQRFQERCRADGQPVSVLVTSRTVVMDHVSVNSLSAAIHLEDFSDDQVALWSRIWNKHNAGYFDFEANRRPLDWKQALEIGEIARQPLLLALVAIYDAETQGIGQLKSLDRTMLYDELVRSFVLRDSEKAGGSSPRKSSHEVQRSMDALASTAATMFANGRWYVSGSDIDEVLRRVHALDPTNPRSDFVKLMREFFFVHISVANLSRPSRTTYEFLHKSFMEYFFALWLSTCIRRFRREESRTGIIDALNDSLRHSPLWYETGALDFVKELLRQQVGDGVGDLPRILFGVAQKELDAQFAAARVGPAQAGILIANTLVLMAEVFGVSGLRSRPSADAASRDLHEFAQNCGPFLRFALSDTDCFLLARHVSFFVADDGSFLLKAGWVPDDIAEEESSTLDVISESVLYARSTGDRHLHALAQVVASISRVRTGQVEPAELARVVSRSILATNAYRLAIDGLIQDGDINDAIDVFRHWAVTAGGDYVELTSLTQALRFFAQGLQGGATVIVSQIVNKVPRLHSALAVDLLYILSLHRHQLIDLEEVRLIWQKTSRPSLVGLDNVTARAVGNLLARAGFGEEVLGALSEEPRDRAIANLESVLRVVQGITDVSQHNGALRRLKARIGTVADPKELPVDLARFVHLPFGLTVKDIWIDAGLAD
jgi:SpoVK/Ycf46/Vps4 family AAA+-type ATPase